MQAKRFYKTDLWQNWQGQLPIFKVAEHNQFFWLMTDYQAMYAAAREYQLVQFRSVIHNF